MIYQNFSANIEIINQYISTCGKNNRISHFPTQAIDDLSIGQFSEYLVHASTCYFIDHYDFIKIGIRDIA